MFSLIVFIFIFVLVYANVRDSIRSADAKTTELLTDIAENDFTHSTENPETEIKAVSAVILVMPVHAVGLIRRHEALLPVVDELGIGFVAYLPLANGVLSNRYAAGNRFDPSTDYRATTASPATRFTISWSHSSDVLFP